MLNNEKFTQDKKFPRIWSRKKTIRDDAIIPLCDGSILAKRLKEDIQILKKINERKGIKMAKIKIKEWKELDKQQNNAYRLEYVREISDIGLGTFLKEGIQVFEKDMSAYPIIYMSVEQFGKESVIELLQHFGFDIEFEKPLTDKEKLDKIHDLVNPVIFKENLSLKLIQDIYDLTKD